MPDRTLIDYALRSLPDCPRWIEARALLLSGHCRVIGCESGFLIRNEAPGAGLTVVVGTPSADAFESALSERKEHELLCVPEVEAVVAARCPNWSRESALLFSLERSEALAPPDPSVRELTGADSLRHLPDELRDEVKGALETRKVWCAFQEKLAASFAYSYWRTERYFDISVDTVEPLRRMGFAQLAVSELIRRERAHGREPVWGAMESNVASQQLAKSLGFEQLDELVLFSNR